MAFTPDTLSEVFQTIGGTFRAFHYITDDTRAQVTAANYFLRGRDSGLRVHDLVAVSSSSADGNFDLTVTAVNTAGTVTVLDSSYIHNWPDGPFPSITQIGIYPPGVASPIIGILYNPNGGDPDNDGDSDIGYPSYRIGDADSLASQAPAWYFDTGNMQLPSLTVPKVLELPVGNPGQWLCWASKGNRLTTGPLPLDEFWSMSHVSSTARDSTGKFADGNNAIHHAKMVFWNVKSATPTQRGTCTTFINTKVDTNTLREGICFSGEGKIYAFGRGAGNAENHLGGSLTKEFVSTQVTPAFPLYTAQCDPVPDEYAYGAALNGSEYATGWTDGIDATGSKIHYGIVAYAKTKLQRIDSVAGYIESPKQPRFTAGLATSVTNVTGDGTAYTFIGDSERMDRGNNHNAASGVYTATAAGDHGFSGALVLTGLLAGHTRIQIQLATTLANFNFDLGIPTLDANGRTTVNLPRIIAPMALNDTARLNIIVFNSTKVVGLLGSGSVVPSFFSGEFLG